MKHSKEYKINIKYQDLVLKDQNIWNQENIFVIKYCIVREGAPFDLKNIGYIIIEEKEELLSLIFEEVEEDNLKC